MQPKGENPFDDKEKAGKVSDHMYLRREIHMTIESPNGDQMPMRYKPEMNVEVVLNHACKRFNLHYSECYLVFNNKEMPLKEQLKNFNIQQNSVLKMFKTRKDSIIPDIFVSVKLKDVRIGSVFRMNDNLWDILYRLLAENSYEPNMVPIVIFKKQELIGAEVLKDVRLKDLGVVFGPCVVRFLQLKQEDLDERKIKEDDDMLTTLESLELKAAGPLTDTGVRNVHFKLSDDEVDSDNVQFVGERKTLAFRLPQFESPEEELQQEYFDLTSDEIHMLFLEVTKKNVSLEKIEIVEGVRSELQKLKDIRTGYDDTIVRVQFPDDSCLQSFFLTEETISDIKEFLRKFTTQPEEEFELHACFEPNEKEVVDEKKSLAELKMVPIARLYYVPENNHEQYLRDEILAGMVSYGIVKEASLMLRGDSLDAFMTIPGDRDSDMRKSTGAFLTKFVRASQSSTKGQGKSLEGSRTFSKHYGKKSYFVKKSWTSVDEDLEGGSRLSMHPDGSSVGSKEITKKKRSSIFSKRHSSVSSNSD